MTPIFSQLYVRLSNEFTPIDGIPRLSAKALTVEIPIRMPVNEPGPMSETNKSISERVKFVSSNICLIRGINVSECVRPLFKFISFIIEVSSNIATPQILLDVVILKIFNLNFLL